MLLCTGLVLAALADSALAGASPPFTWQADLATALGIVAVLTGGLALLVSLRRRHDPAVRAGAVPKLSRAAAASWIGIGVVAVSFELLNVFLSPRAQHPTLSSMVAAVTSHDVLRGLAFIAWLAAGWWIIRVEP